MDLRIIPFFLLTLGACDDSTKDTTEKTETDTDTDTDSDSDTDSDADADADSDADSDADADADSDADADPEYSHSTDIQPLWNNNCSGCHIGGGSSGTLQLDSGYASIVDVASFQLPTMDRVEPNDTDTSYVWAKLNGKQADVGGKGGSMPPSGSLSAADLSLIEAWIKGGALP